MGARDYAAQEATSRANDSQKADGYINVRGVVPKGGNLENPVKIKGQNRVYFPLDKDDPLHKKLMDSAQADSDGVLRITLVAEVRVADNTEQDVSGLDF